MTSSIYDWSITAGNNELSDTAINWQEGQAPSTVNNSARAMMGRLAEFRNDLGGTVTATNVGNAYSVTANSAFSSLEDGLIVTFIAGAANTDAATLAVNGLASKSLRRLGPNGKDDAPLYANQIRAKGRYVCRYSTDADTASGAWIVLNPSSPGFVEVDELTSAPTPVAGGAIYTDSNKKLYHVDSAGTSTQIPFASGTRMVFVQATAPTGWTQDTTTNDRVLRTVSTAADGDGTAGSWAISGVTVSGHALTVAEMPSHTHSVSGTTGTESVGHTHGFSGTTSTTGSHTHTYEHSAVSAGVVSGNSPGGTFVNDTTSAAGDHSHTFSGTTGGISANHTHTFSATSASAGSGDTHTHALTADGTWRPSYHNVLVCAKD